MAQDLPLESPLELAVRRLEQAVASLEARAAASAEARAAREDENGDLFAAEPSFDHAAYEAEKARLAAELDNARAREKALEEVAAEASAALGRAASEVRAALAAGED